MAVCALAGCSKALDFDSLTNGVGSPGEDGGDVTPPPQPDGGTKKGFCDSLPPVTFCDDFDKVPPRAWDAQESKNGLASVDSIASKSPPNSFLSNTSAATSGEVRAIRRKDFAAFADAPTQFRFSFQMRVDKFDGADSAQVLAFEVVFGSDNDFVQVVMNLDASAGALTAKMAENSQKSTGASDGYAAHAFNQSEVKTGEWIAVRIEMDVNTPNGTAGNLLRVYFDNVVQYDGKLDLPLKGKNPRVEIGVGYAQLPANPWTVRFDDFVADLKSLSR